MRFFLTATIHDYHGLHALVCSDAGYGLFHFHAVGLEVDCWFGWVAHDAWMRL
jgi:hypothetical protein